MTSKDREPLHVVTTQSASPRVRAAAETLATYLIRISGDEVTATNGDGPQGIAVGLPADLAVLSRVRRSSEQFRCYEGVMKAPSPFVVTLYNERNATVRGLADGRWREQFRGGTICVSGFGYFAERAEVDGVSYYSTSLASEDGYVLLTFVRQLGRHQ